MNVSETENVVLKYFNSWQSPVDHAEMRSCLSDEFTFDGGSHTLEGGDTFTEMIKQAGAPWTDVTLLGSIFGDREAALFYEGVQKSSGVKMRVAEHILLHNGRIKQVTAVISRLDHG